MVALSGWLTCFAFYWVCVALGMQAWKNWRCGESGIDWLDARFQLERWRIWLIQAFATVPFDSYTLASRLLGIFPAAVVAHLSRDPRARPRQIALAIVWTFLGLVFFLLALYWMRVLLVEYTQQIELFVAAAVLFMGHYGATRNKKMYGREGTGAASWQLALSREVAYILSILYFALIGKWISALLYLWLTYRQYQVVHRFFSDPVTKKEKEEGSR